MVFPSCACYMPREIGGSCWASQNKEKGRLMKLRRIVIHNFRSVLDADIEAHDYMLLVGANNAGKSTIINALRAFYDDTKWSAEDFPKKGAADNEA